MIIKTPIKKKKKDEDIAPVKETKEPVKKNKVVKKSSYFDDGHDEGDIAKTILSTGGDLLANVGKGFMNTVEGVVDTARTGFGDLTKKSADIQADIWDFFGNEAYANNLRKAGQDVKDLTYRNAQMDVTGALLGETNDLFRNNWSKSLNEKSVAGSMVNSVAQGIGNIGAFVGLGALTGGSTLATFGNSFTSAYGNTLTNGLRNGLDEKEAKGQAITSGLAEAISEQFFQGIPGLKSAGWADNLISKPVEKYLKGKTGKIALKVMDSVGEGLEEVISNVLQSTFEGIRKGDNVKQIWNDATGQITNEETRDAFISALISSALTNGGSALITNQQKNSIIKSYAEEHDMSVEETKNLFDSIVEKKANLEETSNYKERVETEEGISKQLVKDLQNNKVDLNELFKQTPNSVKEMQFRFDQDEAKNVKSEKQNILANDMARLNNEKSNHELYKVVNAIQSANDTQQYHITTTEGLYEMGIVNKDENGNYTMPDGSPYVPRGLNYKNGEIYINADVGSQSGTQAVYHEMFEGFKKAAPEQYNEFKQMVTDIIGEDAIQKEFDTYKSMYGEELTDDIRDEIINDKFGELAENQNFINKIADNRNVLEKFIDSIKNMIKYVKGTDEERQLMKLQKNLEKEFAKRYKETDFSQGEGDTAYSLKESKAMLEKQFKDLTGDSLLVAEAKLGNYAFQQIRGNQVEAPYNQEAMDLLEKIQNSKKTSSHLYHSTPADRIQSIAKNGLVVGSKQNQEGVSSTNKLYLSATEELADSFTPENSVMLRISPNAKLENLDNDLLGGEGSYTITNNIEPKYLQVKENGKWIPLLKSKYANDTKYSLTSNKDSQGRELTPQQQEYFKDSKVVDENGNLLEVYHGQNSEHYTYRNPGNKFNNDFASNKMFEGTEITMFTSSEEIADSYIDNEDNPDMKPVKAYLNITNPYIVDAKNQSNKYFLDNDGTPTNVNNLVKRIYDSGEYDGVIIKNVADIGEYYEADITDGRQYATDYIVFNSNQIKNVDNTNPTSNPDIRFSLAPVRNEELDNSSFSLEQQLEKYVYPERVYDVYKNEDKSKITNTIEELQRYKETLDTSTDEGWKNNFETNQKIKALEAGFDNVYDYLVDREKQLLRQEAEGKYGIGYKLLQEGIIKKQKQNQLNEDIKNASKFKNKQFDIIQKTNPAPDEHHTWIRSPKDIKTWQEAMQDEDSFSWGDFTKEDAEEALRKNRITVYSSYNIKNGTFVSTSYQQALDYAGEDRSKVHSKVVRLSDVAWINGDEGQYAKTNISPNEYYSLTSNQNIDSKEVAPIGTTTEETIAPIREDISNLSNQLNNLSNQIQTLQNGAEMTSGNEIAPSRADRIRNLTNRNITPEELSGTNKINDHTLEYKGYYIMTPKPNVGYEYKTLETAPYYSIYDSNNDDMSSNIANWVNSIDSAKTYIDDLVKAGILEDRSNVASTPNTTNDIAPVNPSYKEMQRANAVNNTEISPEEAYKDENYWNTIDEIAQENNNQLDSKLAKKLSKNMASELGLKKKQIDDMQSIINEAWDEGLSYDQIRLKLWEEFGHGTVMQKNEEAIDAQRLIKEYPIKVSDAIKKDITDYGYWKQKYFGKIKFSKDGGDVENVYGQLSDRNPSMFPKDIWNPTDQLLKIAEVADLEKKYSVDYEMSLQDMDAAANFIHDTFVETMYNNAMKQQTDLEEQTLQYNERTKDIPYKKKTRAEVREEEQNKMGITADDLQHGNDISAFSYQITTPERVNEKVFGREIGKKINEQTVYFGKHQEAENTRWKSKERKDIADLGIKARSKESALVQQYGEGLLDDVQLDQAVNNDVEKANKIKHAAKVIRQKYDTYLDMINEKLVDMGYDPIPKRKDYMRHFQELTDKFSMVGIPFNRQDLNANNLPTDINGLTEFNVPGKNWFASALKRTGDKTTFDAITGIDEYLEGAGNLIFHTETIQRYRALEKLIRDTYGQTHGMDVFGDDISSEQAMQRLADIENGKLSNYVAWLKEQGNAIAGKKTALDRAPERLFGRKGYSFFNTLKKSTGSNMTGLNVRSALTNFISSTIAASKTNKMAMAHGTIDTIKNMFHDDGFINKSDFLTSRLRSDTSLSKKTWQKIANAGQIFMSGSDWFTSNLIVRSKYYEGLSKGMTESQAMKYADDFGARVMGDRSKGATAEAFNSKTLGFLTQFQLETNNQWQYMIHDSKMEFQENLAKEGGLKAGATLVFQMGQLAAYSYLFNEMFEQLTGSRAAFDPVDIFKKLFAPDDDDKDKDFETRMKEAGKELADALPFTSLFGSGGRLPISDMLTPAGTLYDYITGGTNKYGQEITLKDVKDEALSSLPYYVLPTGYGQLKKTAQGLGMYDKDNPIPGSYTDSGNLRFTADTDTGSVIKNALFGKWSSKEAQKYRESGYKTIRANDIQEMKDLGMKSSEYREYKENLKEAGTKNADKLDYISSLNIPINEKNIMASNVLDRNVDMSNYDSYEEFDYAYKNPQKYNAMKLIANDYNDYKNYISGIDNVREQNKNLTTEGRKKKVISYVNSLDLTIPQKAMLIRQYYSSYKNYNKEIVNYISNSDMSYEDKVEVLKSLKFKVDDEGNVSW